MAVLLNLNNAEFQRKWFLLEKDEQLAVVQTCRKLAGMEWDAVYRDKGLHWEAIKSSRYPDGSRLYSLRITKRMRAVVRRSGEYLEFIDLFAHHDAAYE